MFYEYMSSSLLFSQFYVTLMLCSYTWYQHPVLGAICDHDAVFVYVEPAPCFGGQILVMEKEWMNWD